MRPLVLLVLPFAWVLLVTVPALAQPSPGGASAAVAQYDQYLDPGSTVGDRAVHDAITAADAIRAASEATQADEENTVSAAELPTASSELAVASAGGENTENATGAQGESASIAEAQNKGANTAEEQSAGTAEEQGQSMSTADLKKLPQTGGPSPIWLGVPLACVGGFLARRIFLP